MSYNIEIKTTNQLQDVYETITQEEECELNEYTTHSINTKPVITTANQQQPVIGTGKGTLAPCPYNNTTKGDNSVTGDYTENEYTPLDQEIQDRCYH